MRKITVTHYRSTTSSGAGAKEVSLDWTTDGVESLTTPVKNTTDREEVPLIMAGRSDGKRGDASVVFRSMFCMDVDCKPKEGESDHAWKTRSGMVRADMLKALQFLAGPAGFDHAWHTTHSHDDDRRLGWRVWIPLAEDVAGSALSRWRDAMHAVNIRVFNRVADTTTYNPERLMRLPATHPERVDLYDHGHRVDGALLTFAEVLKWWEAIPTSERNKQRGTKAPSAPTIYSPAAGEFPLPTELVTRLREHCAQIAQGNQRLKPETRNALSAIARCEALKKGERDNGLTGLIGIFSHRFLEHEARPLLESLLLPVLDKTHAAAPLDPVKPTRADPRQLLDWVVTQVELHRADNQSPDGHTQVTDVEARMVKEWTNGARSGGMAKEELELLAKAQGVDVETFKNQIFVLFGRDAFVWHVDHYFPRLLHPTELSLAHMQAALAGVGLARKKFVEEKSAFKMLTAQDIMSLHSTVAVGIRASYLVERSYFAWHDRHFVEALAPRRKLTPKKHDEIHAWLKAIGGEPLLNWVSTVPQVEKPTAILLLVGERNVGKTLLAQGLAQLWQVGAPAKAHDVLASNFNDDLSRTPFVFADEELPPGTHFRESIGAQLRELVSTPNLTLRRKFMPNVKIDGCVRVMVAGNSDNPLKGFASDGYQPTRADLAAIAERVLLVEARPADDILARVGKEEVSTWRTEFKIAEHALWLRDNWKVKNPGVRFLVEGNSEQALTKLVIGDEFTSQILDWFVSYALHQTKAKTSSIRQGFFATGGELYVTLSVIASSWSDFRPAYRLGSLEPFVNALNSVSHSKRIVAKRGDDVREYWRVKLDYVELYAKRLGMGAAAVKRAVMERDDPNVEIFGGEGETLGTGAKVLPIDKRRRSAEGEI